MEFHLVHTMDEVIKIAMEGARLRGTSIEPRKQAGRRRHRRELGSSLPHLES